MTTIIPNTNVKFSDIWQTYDNAFRNNQISSTWPPSTNISASSFRTNFQNVEFTSGESVPSSGTISIANHFRNRTWQETAITNYSNSTSPSSSMSHGIINTYYKRRLIKINFSQDFIKIKKGAVITGILFYISEAVPETTSRGTHQPFPDYEVAMKSFPYGLSSLSSNPGTSGWTVVRTASDFSATTTGYKLINFNNPFTHGGGDLSISFAWGAIPDWSDPGKGRTYIFSGSSSTAWKFSNQTDDSGKYTSSSETYDSYDTTADIPVIDFITDSHPIERPISSSTSSSSAYGPGLVNTYYERYIIKFNYSESLLNSIGIVNGSKILQISFYITQLPNSSQRTFPSYQIAMKNTSNSVNNNPGTSGWTVVRSASNITFSSTGEVNLFNPEKDITDPFIYNGGTLSFSFGWSNIAGLVASKGKNRVFTGSSTTAKMFYSFVTTFGNWGAPWGTYTFADSANSNTYSNIPLLTFKINRLPSPISIV